MEMNQEIAVAQFLTLARSCQERRLTASEVVVEMIRFYREVRVSGADLEADQDMLLFQWGRGRHWQLSEPTDLRGFPDDQLVADEFESEHVDLARQIVAPGDDEEAEFDGLAIQMGITLIYGPASGKEKSGNMWISSLHKLDQEVDKFAAQPFVSPLFNATPSRYLALVSYCG